MKKFKKLLSVFLAIVMMLSSFAVLANARAEYANPDAYYYDSNDNPRAYLYSDEQRASILMDLIDGFLSTLNIHIDTMGIYVDLNSFDGICDTMSGKIDSLKSLVGGDIAQLNGSEILKGGSRESWGDQKSLKKLIEFLGANGAMIEGVLKDGLNVSDLIASLIKALDFTELNKTITGLPDMLAGLVYGFGNRQITNGIGNDLKYPNTTAWDDLKTKPTIDASLQNILYKLLTEPNNTEPTNNPERNEIITDPEKYGATDAMIHQDKNGYYYIYGTKNAAGEWKFTEASTTTDESDRHDICQWKDGSALVKGAAAKELKEIINLQSGLTLYQMLEKAIPWAYDTFAGHNLDGQLRATLMQFCGAFNNGNVDDATKATLKTKVEEYKALEDAADGDKSKLRDEFAAKQGVAGNYNFMYIDLEGKKIGDKTSDSLYYVVEWGGSWQYYHVELGKDGENVNALFDLIDWEYQAPMWDTIATAAGVLEGKSFLEHINDIVGTILKTAMPSLKWTAGTANNALRDNLVALMKVVIKNAKAEIWGEHYQLPADFDSYTLEQALVLIAGELLDALMPQLVLPATVTSVEEVAVYAVREFTAEIVPHLGAGWDAKIAEAVKLSGSAKEDAFLDILLNMGTSIGAYYLQNLIGLGTVTEDTSNKNEQETVPMGADYTWREILDYIVDWVLDTWLGDLKGNIVDDYSKVMAKGNDQPLLKLSAIFSKLFPSLVRILGADVAATVDGTEYKFALNLEHVYSDLRLALNGDFSELAKGLFRDTADKDSSANKTLYSAIAQLLIDLFGGLGLEDVTNVNSVNSWSKLTGLFTTALATDAPLNKLVGTSADLAKFARYFLECLAGARERWVDDALIFIAMLLGYESPLSMSDISVEGVEAGYTGSETNKVEFTFGFTTKGVKTYFNNGRYRTKAGALSGQKTDFDGDYSLRFIDAEVVNAAGDRKGYTKWGDEGHILTANKTVTGEVEITGITDNIETWTLKVQYTIIYPDGSESDPIFYNNSFAVTKKQNDALSVTNANKVTLEPDTSDWISTNSKDCKDDYYVTALHGKWIINWKNIYINETEDLSKVEAPVLSITDNSYEYLQKKANAVTKPTFANSAHSWAKIWVNGYGYYKQNQDGTWSIYSDEGCTTLSTNLNSVSPIYVDGSTTSLSNDDIQNLWFKWYGNKVNPEINNLAPVPYGTAYNETSPYQQIWLASTSTGRGAFKADFTTYGSSLKLSVTGDASNAGGEAYATGVNELDVKAITPYVVLYNSYGLEEKLKDALKVNAENYDTTAQEWKDFQDAVANAQDQLFGEWVAANFANNHKTTEAYPYTDEDGNDATLAVGSSTFQLAGIRLDETIAALANCKVDDAEGSAGEGEFNERDYSPSDERHPLNGVYNELMAMDAKGYKSHNHVLYRWFKFSDLREGIRYVINAATRPEDAKNTLAGDPYDDEVIAGILSQIDDADVKAIVESLKEAPTAEAIKAAEDAINAWLALPLNYNLDTLNTQIGDMKTNEKRLLPKYDSQQKHYLNKALEDYGNVADDGTYTAESYAKYVTARAKAIEMNNSSTSTQFEIFDSRYHFLVAYNNLVLTKEAVDMTALEASMAEAQAILDAINTEDEFSLAADATVESLEEAYKQLVVALGIKVTYDETEYFVGGNFSGVYAHEQKGMITAAEQQPWVDSVTANLDTAIANFKAPVTAVPELLLSAYGEEIGAVISRDWCSSYDMDADGNAFAGCVMGIDTLGVYTMDAIIDCLETPVGSITVNTDATGGVETTGAVIELRDENDEIVERYVFIYFGDVDCDGAIMGGDGTAIMDYEATYEGFEYEYLQLAADVDGDGAIMGGDGVILIDYEGSYDPEASYYPSQADLAALYA